MSGVALGVTRCTGQQLRDPHCWACVQHIRGCELHHVRSCPGWIPVHWTATPACAHAAPVGHTSFGEVHHVRVDREATPRSAYVGRALPCHRNVVHHMQRRGARTSDFGRQAALTSDVPAPRTTLHIGHGHGARTSDMVPAPWTSLQVVLMGQYGTQQAKWPSHPVERGCRGTMCLSRKPRQSVCQGMLKPINARIAACSITAYRAQPWAETHE